MLISLSGSGQVAPNFWLNWNNGVNYNVGVQTPQYRIDSLDALLRTPISVATSAVNGALPRVHGRRRRCEQLLRRRFAERLFAGLRKSGSGARQHAALSNLVTVQQGLHAGDREPLQRSARCSTCTPMSTGAIWAAWAPMCEKIMREEESASAARHIARLCAARSPPCRSRSSGWGWE